MGESKAIKHRDIYQSLIEHSKDITIVLSKEGKSIYFSQNTKELFGVSKRQISDKSLLKLIHPEYRAEVEKLISKFKSKTKVKPTEIGLQIKTAAGKYQWYDLTVHKITSEQISSTALVFRKSGNPLDDDYNFLFVQSPFPKWIYNKNNHTIIDVNKAAIEQYGYSKKEFLNMTIKDLRPKEDVKKLIQFEKNRKQEQGLVNYGIWRHKKKNGEIIKVEVSGHFVKFNGQDCGIAISVDVTEREKRVEEIRKNREFTENILSSITSNIAVLDENGNILRTNRSWDKFAIENNVNNYHKVGVGNNYLEVSKIAVKNGDEYAKKAVSGINSVLKKKKRIFQLEYPCHSPEEERWFLLTATPFFGKSNYIIVRHDNITERKLNERELNLLHKKNVEAVQNIKMLFSISPDLIAIAGTDGYFKTINKAFEKTLGYTSKELLSKPFMDFVHPDDVKSTLDELNKVRKGKPTLKFINRYICKNGSYKWIEWNSKPVGDIIYTIARDITDRKKNEEHLITLNKEKQNILESISDGFFALDNNWKINYFNNSAQEMLEVSAKKVLGKHFFDTFRFSEQSMIKKTFLEVAKNRVNKSFKFYDKKINKWFEVDIHSLETGISVFFRDITYNKVYEQTLKRLNFELEERAERLAASNKELEQFAYIASHDLQEPLRMVSSFLELLEKKYEGNLDEKGKKYIHFAVDGANRMRKIIIDLLEYSRLNKQNSENELFAVQDVIKTAIQFNSENIKQKKAKVVYGNMPSIFAHKSSIQQVFSNLISNALKYQKENTPPKINIKCKDKTTHWQFSISDNGIGIEAEYFEKIFVIFQRLHRKEEYSGTGIGLAICKKIIEQHNGEMWLESTPGKGTTFYFTIKKTENKI